jgi:transcriptional regulator with GAF, ATPase, and Fis domain
MKANPNRIEGLAGTLSALLDREQQASRETISSLIELVKMLQGDTADRRFKRIAAELKRLQDRFDLLAQMARADFLPKIKTEAAKLARDAGESRAASVVTSLIDHSLPSLNAFCDLLLDRLIDVTGAERGFILFYVPESTEADVISARNFQTRNLSLEEYDFSRTLLREVFQLGESLLLEDASSNAAYSREISVIKFSLKSVVTSPLKQESRTVGALYLENNTVPCAFDESDAQLLERIARFAVSYLHHARLLPVSLDRDSRVFLDSSKAASGIIGRDPKILSLLELIKRLADSPATVLIEGESGAGKELVARALHYQSARRDRPFVAISCAAIPDNLLESELFGHEKGAFTGASERYIGRIEQGDGGTIFLDEVSELAYPLQAKLLRFLQSNEFNRLGGRQTVHVDSRVVAATSKDLKAMMAAGRFQEALYYRLNVIPVLMPALRERKQDIPLLITHFLAKFSAIYGKQIRMEREASDLLTECDFPGNVRELENLIHRLVALASDDVIPIGDLPAEILQMRAERVSLQKDSLYHLLETPPSDLEELRHRKQEIRKALAEQERVLVERVIEEAGGNLTLAASRLGRHRITLHKLLKRTGKVLAKSG